MRDRSTVGPIHRKDGLAVIPFTKRIVADPERAIRMRYFDPEARQQRASLFQGTRHKEPRNNGLDEMIIKMVPRGGLSRHPQQSSKINTLWLPTIEALYRLNVPMSR
jgi:hypothetical protein